MKQYAIVRDIVRNEPFGYVVKSGNTFVAYGVHAAGRTWADSYNEGYSASLHEDLPAGVEVGRFAPITDNSQILMKALDRGHATYLPEPPRFFLDASESYLGDDQPTEIKGMPLSAFPEAFKQSAINYKAAAFRSDRRYFNIMAKARYTRASITRSGTGLQSKSLSEAAFEHVATSPTAMRRAALDLSFFKEERLDEMGFWTPDDILEKKLGPKLGAAGRVEPYDPDAIDGDEDGIVQDGTPWARPASPRARMLGRLANQARSTAKPSQERGFRSGKPRDRSEEPGLNDNEIAGDAMLEEYGVLSDALELVRKTKPSDPEKERSLAEFADALDNAVAANDMIVLDRDDFALAKEAVDEWMSDPNNLPGGFVSDLQGIMEEMADADKDGKIWQSLSLEQEGTRLSMPEGGRRGFASSGPDKTPLSREELNSMSKQELANRLLEDRFAGLTLEEAARKYGLKDRLEARRIEAREMQRRNQAGEPMPKSTRDTGFASGNPMNRNKDTAQSIVDGRGDFTRMGDYKRAASSTKELLEILEGNGFAWVESSDGYKIYPPDRIRKWILANTKRDEGGYRGSDHVLVHLSQSGKEDASLKKFISQNLGGDAWKDLKANAKKKGDLRGSGPVGPVASEVDDGPGRGFGSRSARMREAAVTRAAAPRGFAARGGKKKGRVPGVDKVSDRDGKIWEQLTPEQRATLKEATQRFERELLKTIAQKFPPFARGFYRDFRDKPFDKATMNLDDFAFKNTEELLQFSRYIEERIMSKDDLDPKQKLTIQRYLDNISALTRMRLNDNYENTEHLHEAARKSIFKFAGSQDSAFPSLGKVNGGGDSTFFGRAAGLDKETYDKVVAGVEDVELGKLRRRLDRIQKRLVTDILRPNPVRQQRRELRRQRRRSGRNVGAFRTQEAEKLTLTERTRRAAGRLRRQARRLVGGRRDEKKVMSAIDKKEAEKMIREVDGKMVLAPDATKRLNRALRIITNDPDALKDITNKGSKGQGDVSQSKEMAAIWDASGFNGLPELLTADELFSLAEAGHQVIVRGHGDKPQNADDWLSDPIRFLPGQGGSAAGLGEYWSDAITGDGWFGWLKGGNTNTVAVLPKNSKIIDQKDLSPESSANRKYAQAWNLARQAFPDGMDKAPLDEVVTALKEQLQKVDDTAKKSRVGQIIEQLLASADKGDKDAIASMELFARIAEVDKNLLAPLLGYDAIRIGDTDGRILVMSRPAVAALDKAVDSKKVMEWVDVAKKVKRGQGASMPGMPDSGKKAPKLNKATNAPSWDKLQAMKKVQGPLGSQGGQWYEDSNGQRYLAKPARSLSHAANEAAVAAIYREFGIGAPTAAMTDASGNPQVVVTGLQVQNIGSPNAQLQAEAKKHMGIDMLLANWDAYGAGGQNIGVDAQGRLIRLDAGGGGRFRAQGGDKPSFTPGQIWDDPATMITSSFGQQFYGTVTNGDVTAAMRQVAAIDIAKMDAAMKAAGVDDQTRKFFRDVIADRKREAVRYEALFSKAPQDNKVRTSGSGAGATFSPG